MNNKIKRLTVMALCAALSIVLSLFSIHILGSSLQITFSFIVSMLVASIFSLKECIVYGIVVDVLSFFLTQYGEPFFLGYTISAVLGLMIYWYFLSEEVNLKNIILAKLFVNVIVNVFVGSIWRTILYSKGFIYYVCVSASKNLLVLPVEVIMFYLIYRLLPRSARNFEKK